MNKILNIDKISKNIFKITRYKEEFRERESLFVKDVSDSSSDERYSYEVNEDGLVSFYVDNKLVLKENDTTDTLSFKISKEDAIYGLGIHQFKSLNRRNSNIQMLQYNGRSTAIPFLTSTGNYSILFDNTSYMSFGIDRKCTHRFNEDFDDGEPSIDNINVFIQDNLVVTYYVILGDFDDQIRGYRYLTGKATMLPRWAYGYFQSKEHYHTQNEIVKIAHEFRNRHIPIDCIVQDWNYWGKYGWNALRWDEDNYPDPKAMMDEIHSLDMKIMVSVWPSFGKDTEVAKELYDNHAAITKKSGVVEKWGRIHDPYNPKGADIFWRNMKENVFDKGCDAWWLDSTEPGANVDKCSHLLASSPCYLGKNYKYLNSYGLVSARNVYNRQRACEKNKRVYILTRSGYASQQEYAISTWTGDIEASYECLDRQIQSLLNFSMSGIPYSTTDIGGFFVRNYEGGCKNEEYRELYTRWYWFGLFSPIFRSHGTNTPREIWNYGEKGEPYFDSLLKATKIRYALMPYFYSLAYDIYKNDKLFIKPLVYNYKDDEKTKNIVNSYLVGDSLYVTNVTKYKQREIDVYLPKGDSWFDLYDGTRYEGGQTIKASCPVDKLPIFVKGGSIVLTTEPEECTKYQTNEEIDVRIYSSKDAHAFYYDDDGDNYDYEKDDNLIINFDYDDSEKSLTISSLIGNSKYRVPSKFNIYLDNKLIDSVVYNKEEIRVSLKK